MAGLFTSQVVEVTRTEYAELVRESEQNNTIRRMLKKGIDIGTKELKIILCVEDKEAPNSFEELPGE